MSGDVFKCAIAFGDCAVSVGIDSVGNLKVVVPHGVGQSFFIFQTLSMRSSITRSKAIQLSAVLTLSAIVSGCTTPNVSAVATEPSSFNQVDEPEILHDAPGQSEDYYQDQNRFFDSEFDYDDAAILARYWGESVSDAKARIGD